MVACSVFFLTLRANLLIKFLQDPAGLVGLPLSVTLLHLAAFVNTLGRPVHYTLLPSSRWQSGPSDLIVRAPSLRSTLCIPLWRKGRRQGPL